jgi:hypothetical protein
MTRTGMEAAAERARANNCGPNWQGSSPSLSRTTMIAPSRLMRLGSQFYGLFQFGWPEEAVARFSNWLMYVREVARR